MDAAQPANCREFVCRKIPIIRRAHQWIFVSQVITCICIPKITPAPRRVAVIQPAEVGTWRVGSPSIIPRMPAGLETDGTGTGGFDTGEIQIACQIMDQRVVGLPRSVSIDVAHGRERHLHAQICVECRRSSIASQVLAA